MSQSHKVTKSQVKFLILVFIFFAAGCQARTEKEKAQEIIPVRVSRIELKDIYESLDYVGNIKAKDEATVYPKVSGKIIEKVREDNSPVTKGEPIIYIDRDEVGLKFEKAPVESPITGIIGRVYVDIGQNVSSLTPVALVVNMDQAKIDLDIPEKYLARVLVGQNANVYIDAFPEEKFIGSVTKISPIVDLDTRSAPVEITIDNSQHLLKSGMFAKVELIVKEYKNAPVIIKEAIIGKEPNLYVYVIEGKTAHLKEIKLGIRKGAYFEVKEGLKEGDLIVIVGQQRLYEGAIVTMEEVK